MVRYFGASWLRCLTSESRYCTNGNNELRGHILVSNKFCQMFLDLINVTEFGSCFTLQAVDTESILGIKSMKGVMHGSLLCRILVFVFEL